METINTLIQEFGAYSKEFPIIAGSLGLWFIGTASYFCKSIPNQIWTFIVKHTTTRMTLISSHTSFHAFLKWYTENGYSKGARNIKLSNGRYGGGSDIQSVGYGTDYFIFNSTIVRLTMSSMDASASEKEKDRIELVIIGRSHKTFNRIFEEIRHNEEENNDSVVIREFGGCWEYSSKQRKRPLKTIHLNEGIKEELTTFIDNFKSNEDFHIENGIHHQTAILLHGPPGTGKTSIIKSIASEYDAPIHVISAASLDKIEKAFASLPEHAIVIIEDIDSAKATHKRSEAGEVDLMTSFSLASLSDILNAIDGIHTTHGRILIATTNHIDKLDPALIREGRFDLKLKIDHADQHVVEQFIERFFPDEKLPEGTTLQEKLSSAKIQSMVLRNLNNFSGFIKGITKDEPIITKRNNSISEEL